MKRITFLFVLAFIAAQVVAQDDAVVAQGNNLVSLITDINLSGANANYFNERGLMFEQQKDYEKALFLREGCKHCSRKHNFLFNKGITLQNLDRHAEAVEVFQELVDIDNTDFEAFVALGTSLGRIGEYDMSLKHDKAERLRPSYKRIYYQRAMFKNLAGNYPSAERF